MTEINEDTLVKMLTSRNEGEILFGLEIIKNHFTENEIEKLKKRLNPIVYNVYFELPEAEDKYLWVESSRFKNRIFITGHGIKLNSNQSDTIENGYL